MKRLFSVALAVLLIVGLTVVCARADMKPVIDDEPTDFKALFKKYWELSRNRNEASGDSPKASDSCPGWIVGEWAKKPDSLFYDPWPYRKTTYEVLFPDKKSIARVIYGLALFTRDLDPSVSLERFERGAGGFHYDVEQVVEWAVAVTEKRWKIYTREEKEFLRKLVADRVILEDGGRVRPSGRFSHILGAAPQKTRSLALNLNHERIHVLWDEDPAFKERYTAKWRSLTPEEKSAVYKRLKGYNPEDEMQIIEEWAVRQNEDKPLWQGGR
jgi:hypothetical protein